MKSSQWPFFASEVRKKLGEKNVSVLYGRIDEKHIYLDIKLENTDEGVKIVRITCL